MSPVTATNLLRTESPQSPIPFTEYVTLIHQGTFSDGEGDSYRILSRVQGSSWSARRLERDRLSANFQGDPLWPKKVLAKYKALSEYFALNSSAEDCCILPMTKTINRKLGLLTGSESGFRDLRDYSQPISDRAYVDAFIEYGILPMGEIQDRDSVHDWAYHFVTFLLPDYLMRVREALAFVRARIHLCHGETEYAWNYYGHTLNAQGQMQGRPVKEKMAHVDAVYRQMAISLDVATAKPVQLLALELAGRIQACQGEQRSVGVYMGGVTQEAIDQILWMEPKRWIAAPKRSALTEVMPYLNSQLKDLEARAN